MSDDEPDPASKDESSSDEQDLAAAIDAIFTSLGDLTDRLIRVEEGQEEAAEDEDTVPRSWASRATPGDWVELADWVDWVNTFYSLKKTTRIRPCWPRHHGIVEELAGIHAAWRSAMLVDDVKQHIGDTTTAFHTQWFWPALQRISGASSNGGTTTYDMSGFASPGGCTNKTCELDSDKYEEPAPTDRSRFPTVDDDGVIHGHRDDPA